MSRFTRNGKMDICKYSENKEQKYLICIDQGKKCGISGIIYGNQTTIGDNVKGTKT